jgi:hypothetical protein
LIKNTGVWALPKVLDSLKFLLTNDRKDKYHYLNIQGGDPNPAKNY